MNKETPRVVGLILLVAMLGGVAFTSASVPRDCPGKRGEKPHVAAYYFHRTLRCHTCVMMEELVRGVLERDFANQLENGQLLWGAFDYELPENKDLVKAYGVGDGPALILSRCESGKECDWRELAQVWEMTADSTRLIAHIHKQVSRFLEPDSTRQEPEDTGARKVSPWLRNM